ncbi:MAG: DUF6531 domain-containing protein [Myxococcota bacterium]
MSVASKWFDLVVGVDLHMELVPPSPAPVPFPHPFVGMVWDPVGLIIDEMIGAGMALLGAPPPPGPVLIGGVPATATGDEAMMPTGHILLPPGVSWAPIPKVPAPSGGKGGKPGLPDLPAPPAGDAMLAFGSQTVEWRGGRAVRMGDPALSCSDPMRLPTSFVISAGPTPVLVGGPVGPDWAMLAAAVGLGALRTKWASKLAHAGIEKFVPKRLNRARDFLHDAACFVTGHPVNVVNGSMFTTWADLELPGPIPLSFTRRYRTSFCDRDTGLGYGWTHNLDQRLWLEEGRVVYLTEDGRELEFDTWEFPDRAMRKGDEVFDPVSRFTLRALGQFRWSLVGPDGLRREFGPVPGESPRNKDRGLARLLSISNRVGDTITLGYDERAQLHQIRDSGGRPIALQYDRQGRIATLWVPAADGEGMRQHAAFAYSPEGDLVQVTDAVGKSVRFRYDHHTLVQETDRNGLSFHFEYEGWGPFARCTRTWGDGRLYDHLITYDVKGRRTVVEDSLGHPTLYEWGPYGLVTCVTDPRGGATRYEYDDCLRRTVVTDPLGHTTRTTYDARGNPIMVVEPDGAITRVQYDEHDAPLALQTPRGGTWRWTYDREGRQLTETDPLGLSTRFHHQGARLVAIDDPGGARTTLHHDGAGNLQAIEHADGSARKWRHDALGRPIVETNAKGANRRITYDALGRAVRIDEADGNTRQLAYDGEGNVVRARDRLRDVAFTYQGLGVPTSRTIGGTTVRFEYDTEERLTAFINEKGHAYRFERDPAGDLLAELCFDETKRVYKRDAAGRITKLLRPGVGRSSEYGYDPAGRVLSVTHSDGLTEQFVYDEQGALVEASNTDTTLRFERDLRGRVVVEHQGEHSVTSQLDHRGLRVGMESSMGGALEVARNAMGEVVGLVARHGERRWETKITRDVLGLEVDRQLPGGARSYWWRDDLGRPTQQWVGKEKKLARGRRYTWSFDDRLTQIFEEGQGEQRFEHDPRGNLVRTTLPNGRIESRVPDEVGNLFRTAEQQDREYGVVGELKKEQTAEGVVTYRYDSEGNLIEREQPDGGLWAYEWDGAGRLVLVRKPDESEVTFAYDPLGRRISKTADGKTTRWVWDGDVVLHELAGDDGEEVVTWVFDPEEFSPAARLDAEGAHSVVTDHLGTPLCLIDEAGETRWQGSIDAWGQMRIAGDEALCPWRYPGQYEDAETGLCYNRFRYFDPKGGAYISRDPLGLAGGVNLHGYVDDPLVAYDPLGLTRKDYELGGFAKGVEFSEVAAINRRFGGTTALTGSIDAVLASAARQRGFFNKAAVVVRGIAGRHLYDNGNKRTAHAVLDLLRQRNGVSSGVDPTEVRKAIARIARGELTEIPDIARALRGF